MTNYVLDSFALTAYVEHEPGRARVSEVMEEARSGTSRVAMMTVNLGESLYTARRRRGPEGLVHVLNLFADLPVELVNADLAITIAAARIKAVTPISYGDCYAAALALERGAVVLTGDPEFRLVDGILRIDWLPRVGHQ